MSVKVVRSRDTVLPYFVGVMAHEWGGVRISFWWWQIVVRW